MQDMNFGDFCEIHEITMTAQSRSARTDRVADNWDETAFHFWVELKIKDRPLWSGFYSVGAGHPTFWASTGAPVPADAPANIRNKAYRAKCAYQNMDQKPTTLTRGFNVFDQRPLDEIKEAYAACAPIDVADVFQSLVMDCGDADESFNDWAEGLGYNPDSRKAFETYQACQDIARQLRSSLGLDLFAEALKLDECAKSLDDWETELRAEWAEDMLPNLEPYADDEIALNEEWNNWTDAMASEGVMPQWVADRVERS